MSEDLEKKLVKLPGGREFMESVMGLSNKDLEARISQMQKALDESEEHREANEALKNAKDEVKLISGPYNDVKKAVKLKTKFIISLLKEKGGM